MTGHHAKPADGKHRRAKGALPLRHAQLQRRQMRHDRLLAAAREARASGDAWVTIEGLRVQLTHDPNRALSEGFYTHLELVRTKRMGLCLGAVNEKRRGHVTLHGSFITIGLRGRQTVAYVSALEKDGARIGLEAVL